jgi:hypothetical protein
MTAINIIREANGLSYTNAVKGGVFLSLLSATEELGHRCAGEK